MKVRDKTVLITGGSSGIAWNSPANCSRGGIQSSLQAATQQARCNETRFAGVHFFESDVSDLVAIAALHTEVLGQFPNLDVLINNAGVMRSIDLQQIRDLMDVTREIDIDLCGPIRMVQQFLPHLKTRKDALIINVSSGLAFVPMPISPIYCAAKAAIHSYSQSLRVQLAETGVRVVELAPPPVETPLLRGEFEEETAGRRAMSPQALVKHAIAGIEGGRHEIRPGVSNVLKTMSRIAPGFMLARMTAMNRRSADAVGKHPKNLQGEALVTTPITRSARRPGNDDGGEGDDRQSAQVGVRPRSARLFRCVHEPRSARRGCDLRRR